MAHLNMAIPLDLMKRTHRAAKSAGMSQRAWVIWVLWTQFIGRDEAAKLVEEIAGRRGGSKYRPEDEVAPEPEFPQMKHPPKPDCIVCGTRLEDFGDAWHCGYCHRNFPK